MRLDIYGHGQILYECFVLSIVTRDLESNKVAKFANLYTNNSSKHMGEELQMNIERLSGWVIEGRKISETKFIKSNI